MKKINSVLKEVLKKIEVPKSQYEEIGSSLKSFLEKFSGKIDAEIYVGGSWAKKTAIKKDVYDVDIFIRFENEKEPSRKLEKALKRFENVSKVHGSRDYFKVKMSPEFFIELVPVKKIKNPKEAENITDLSYSHVKYINSKIKSKKVLEDIKLAKAFCFATNTYGAESYIKGFSGYALELLVYHYGSFLKFIKEIAKSKNEKIIIDIEKHYKNKKNVLLDINSSKLDSPIILIDPTYKQRNALAALSKETFEKFRNECKKFLENPSEEAFEKNRINFEETEKEALRKKQEFVKIEIKTNKQEGDIAGSKLVKFYNHLKEEIKKYFELKKEGFEYYKKKTGKGFFIVKAKKEVTLEGPFINDKKNVERFKREHKRTFDKNKKIYAKKKIDFSCKEFLNGWKRKYNRRLKEMDISELSIS